MTEDEAAGVRELAEQVKEDVEVRGPYRVRDATGRDSVSGSRHPVKLPTNARCSLASSSSTDPVSPYLTILPPTVQSYAPHALFCTTGTYLRYLRARSHNVHKAARMLRDTLAWRASYKPHLITWSEIESEVKLKKVTILDEPDRDGRPVVFMRPRNEKQGSDNELKLKYVVYVMEHASRIADASSPDGKMAWLLDYVGYTRHNQPPWKVSLSTLSIVQNHYPERLGRAVNFKPPLLFEIFWKAIRPFVDPVTRDKLVFLSGKDVEGESLQEEMGKYFALEALDDMLGGVLEEQGMIPVESYEKRMLQADDALAEALEGLRVGDEKVADF